MRTAEIAYIHQLLEPNELIQTGNAKRWGLLTLPPRQRLHNTVPDMPIELEAESNLKQDEYLERHGIK